MAAQKINHVSSSSSSLTTCALSWIKALPCKKSSFYFSLFCMHSITCTNLALPTATSNQRISSYQNRDLSNFAILVLLEVSTAVNNYAVEVMDTLHPSISTKNIRNCTNVISFHLGSHSLFSTLDLCLSPQPHPLNKTLFGN
jgi:hypothetical protein